MPDVFLILAAGLLTLIGISSVFAPVSRGDRRAGIVLGAVGLAVAGWLALAYRSPRPAPRVNVYRVQTVVKADGGRVQVVAVGDDVLPVGRLLGPGAPPVPEGKSLRWEHTDSFRGGVGFVLPDGNPNRFVVTD